MSSIHAAWQAAQQRLPAVRAVAGAISQPSAATVQRIGQIDSEQLDHDLVQLLKEPVAKALNLLNSSLSFKLDPELVAVIRAILYKFAVWDTGATYGARLQGLRYSRPSHTAGAPLTPSRLPRSQLLSHAALTILLPYLHTRARGFALSRAWPDAPVSHYRRRLWDLLILGETLHAHAALVAFCLFLHNGRYRTLADRALGLRLVTSQQITSRAVSYEFMNRQMVWHAFTEFLLFMLPLVNMRTLRRRLSSSANQLLDRIRDALPPPLKALLAPLISAKQSRSKATKYAGLPEGQCAICVDNTSLDLTTAGYREAETHEIQTPYRASCGHVYCYHCLATSLMHAASEGEKGWECLRCGELVASASRVTTLSLLDDDSPSLDSLDVDNISLDSYDSLRPASSSVSISSG